MTSFNYCDALESCDAEFQKRKRRIVEVEDAIENLRMAVEDVGNENKLLQNERRLHTVEEQIFQSDFDAVSAKKIKICTDIEQYEIEIANLTQQIAHAKTQMEDSETFMRGQQQQSQKCEDIFADGYLKYSWIANYEDAKKQHENIMKVVSDNQMKIASLEEELSQICTQNSEQFNIFIGSCVTSSQLMSKINSSEKQMTDNTHYFKRIGNCKDRILRGMPVGIQQESGNFRKRIFNSENKTLSRSIISQRTSPPICTTHKAVPLRERQLSSQPTLPYKKLPTSRLTTMGSKPLTSLSDNLLFKKRS